ncbi:SH3 domain-containing protein [Staphylococcus pseudoxylosus]|uniref:SH3 domain-containing protein n=1 Tax=Staphylococcus pseudoxylosus TaxID=2282419 RepID=UPI002DB954AF|nr:SH3 domain-containing protein [Staphylococcus pseudoxylosus]MEB7763876.1 SH3 domain-containing protein [Staphylococcus pseudoxylosus]
MKKQEAVNWAVKNIGKSLTAGQSNGAQCATFIIEFLKKHFDVHPTGNAVDFIDYKYPEGFQIIKNTKEFIPQKGDIFVLDDGSYGHTGMITNANQYLFDSIDQNWYNASNNGSPAAFIQDHVYDDFVGVIRPPYKDAENGVTTESTKIETINHSINYTMNERVGSIDGVVIHNTADSISAKEQYNRLSNAAVARYEGGVAHYYGDRKAMWRAIDTFRIAWHLADSYGNGHYLGYEACDSMGASNKDFAKNEQAVFKQAAIDMLYYGLKPNRKTVKLHNQFVATACPHRSMALHVDFDPIINGAPPTAKQHEMQDFFIKEITKYYKNPTLDVGVPDNVTDGVTIPTDEQKKNPVKDKGKKVGNKWRRNQHNILWKPEKGTFTATTNIYTRYNGPWTGWEIAGMLYAGQSVNYDEVYDFDGYIWIAWTVDSGARVYLPIGDSNGNGSRIGDAWGIFS